MHPLTGFLPFFEIAPMLHFVPYRYFGKSLIAVLCAGAWMAQAQTVDVAAAEDLARKSNCTKCHSVAKERLGPAFKTTAEKYRGRADAVAVLVTHMTTGPKIILDDEEEMHQIVKSTDEAEINNLARYILSW
jgi:cytochrome c